MSKRTAGVAAGYVLAATITFGATGSSHAAECLTAPDGAASPGRHWYYHVDRANNRKCWYVARSAMIRRKGPEVASTATENLTNQTALLGKSARDALFEEFLQWQKNESATTEESTTASPSNSQEMLFEEFLQWQRVQRMTPGAAALPNILFTSLVELGALSPDGGCLQIAVSAAHRVVLIASEH